MPTVKKVVTTAAVNSGGSGSGSEAARLVFFISLHLSLYFCSFRLDNLHFFVKNYSSNNIELHLDIHLEISSSSAEHSQAHIKTLSTSPPVPDKTDLPNYQSAILAQQRANETRLKLTDQSKNRKISTASF